MTVKLKKKMFDTKGTLFEYSNDFGSVADDKSDITY